MNFKKWFNESNDFQFYRNLVSNTLKITDNGLSQSLNSWNPEELITSLNGLGEFTKLSDSIKDQVIGQIKSGSGTLEDIINIMASQSEL